MKDTIMSNADLAKLLDKFLEKKSSEWWNEFYKTRGGNIPFYCDKPDESLVDFITKYKIKAECALDIGCGIGRNTKYMSEIGCETIGIDIAEAAINEAKLRYGNIQRVGFQNQSIFDHIGTGYDLIHDSGCLHHIPPHRRFEYLELVYNKLKEDGYFSLVCFNENQGKGMSDIEVYKSRSMQGGMLYSREKLTTILEPYFEILEFREMKELNDRDLFGLSINWAVFMKKKKLIV